MLETDIEWHHRYNFQLQANNKNALKYQNPNIFKVSFMLKTLKITKNPVFDKAKTGFFTNY